MDYASQELGPLMATVDGDEEPATMKAKPVMLTIFETTVFAVKKPVKVLLSLVAGVFSARFLAGFLQTVLEVHAEHEHIAPGWLGKFFATLSHSLYPHLLLVQCMPWLAGSFHTTHCHCLYDCCRFCDAMHVMFFGMSEVAGLCCCVVDGLGKTMAGLDHIGLLVLEFTEVALIIFG